MRVGSFAIDKNGQHADVSIIPLGGSSGGELANVNRWRGQVGLEAVDEARLAAQAEKVNIGSTPASLYDLKGTDPKSQQPTRIVGSMLTAEGTTWFFKMVGSDGLVAEEKPAFKQFLASIQFQGAAIGEAATGTPKEVPHPMSTNTRSVPGMNPSFTGSQEKPVLDVPPGWQEQAPSSMRVASFAVSGENGAKADVSVVQLGGMGGGILANVNRWRSQLGLAPVDDAGLEKLIITHEVGGTRILQVDLSGQSVESGQKARLLAAIVPRSSATWFYKMVGDDQLVSQQKPAFSKLVETARYPNAP
jgi:hypothetical protein